MRLRSSVLGPLSPSYQVSAQRPGPAETARLRLVRELASSALPGLRVDLAADSQRSCKEQMAAISNCVEQQGLLEGCSPKDEQAARRGRPVPPDGPCPDYRGRSFGDGGTARFRHRVAA